MYRMTRLFLFTLFLFGPVAYSQDKYPTKSQLLKSLTKKTSLKKKVYNSTNWFALENDSSFQTADTVTFYNNKNYRQGKPICNFIDWNFYKKDAFWVQQVQLCKEPTTATALKDQFFFTFQISDSSFPLILSVFNRGTLVDEFEVLSLRTQSLPKSNETFESLTL